MSIVAGFALGVIVWVIVAVVSGILIGRFISFGDDENDGVEENV